MMLTFEAVTTTGGLENLRSEWARLDDGRGPGAVFRSWEWQATWWRTLGRGPRRSLRVVCGRDRQKVLRGLLPLYLEEAPVLGFVPRRRVGFLADGVVGSDYLGLVAPADEQRLLAPAFAAQLVRDPVLRCADLVELNDLLVGDPLGDALAAELRAAGFEAIAAAPRYRCPFARLDGDDLQSYLDARPAGFGAQLLARRRDLENRRGFGLAIHEKPDAVAHGLDALFALHRARWAEEGGSDAFVGGGVEIFHREAAIALAARGWARLALLSVDGRAVAAGYGFARAGRFAYYQAGLDPAWRKSSVGTVVLGELIGRAFGEQLTEFDFLRGEESYKQIWATDVRQTFALQARPRAARARMAAAAVGAVQAARAGAHKLLPERAVDWLRRARKARDHR